MVASCSSVVPEQVDLFTAAFECDSYSSLSIYRTEGPGSMLNERGTSGRTARAVLRYLNKHRPKIYVGENVRQRVDPSRRLPTRGGIGVLDARGFGHLFVGKGGVLLEWGCFVR